MPKPSLYEEFSKGLADAVTDIRQKAVEEPWFGKEVTEGWPEAREKESPQQQPDLEQEQEVEEEIDL